MTDEKRNELVEKFLPACRRMAGLWGKHGRRAGLRVDSEDLYSEAYTYLIEKIIPGHDATKVPLQQWVNLKLRARLSDYLMKLSREQHREIITDIDDLLGVAAPPPDENYAQEIRDLLMLAAKARVISPEQFTLLTMVSKGTRADVAGELIDVKPRQAYALVAKAKKDIREKVLNIAN